MANDSKNTDLDTLISSVRRCDHCTDLPLGPKPILQGSTSAKIMVVGQAPGVRAHTSGTPFDDPSGDRLRDWMGVSPDTFYDAQKIAILPMGFCYPGTGKSGDLPPRPECAEKWRHRLLDKFESVSLVLIIGAYAMDWHLDRAKGETLTNTVQNWRSYMPHMLPLPHPSPRNNRWLARNPWFEAEVLPQLKARIQEELNA